MKVLLTQFLFTSVLLYSIKWHSGSSVCIYLFLYFFFFFLANVQTCNFHSSRNWLLVNPLNMDVCPQVPINLAKRMCYGSQLAFRTVVIAFPNAPSQGCTPPLPPTSSLRLKTNFSWQPEITLIYILSCSSPFLPMIIEDYNCLCTSLGDMKMLQPVF